MRYRLLDYFYTALHLAHTDGVPVLQPLWFQYPKDTNTYPIDLQFLFGDFILVSPVTQENVTSVSIYLPNDTFYDFKTYEFINGTGASVDLSNVDYTQIPVYIRGGVVLPLRVESANTTTALRKKDFELVVAPNRCGRASGSLYIDDGISIQQQGTLDATYTYGGKSLKVNSMGRYNVGSLKYLSVKVLGVTSAPHSAALNGQAVSGGKVAYNSTSKSVTITVAQALGSSFTLKWD